MVFLNSLFLSVKISVYMDLNTAIEVQGMVSAAKVESDKTLSAFREEANTRIQQLEARIEKLESLLESLLKARPPSTPVTETA